MGWRCWSTYALLFGIGGSIAFGPLVDDSA